MEEVEKVDPKYVRTLIDRIDWFEIKGIDCVTLDDKSKIVKTIIALLIEMNLNIGMLCQLLNQSMFGAKEDSNEIICPKCKTGVIPNNLGYCPICKTDLAQIIQAMKTQFGRDVRT